MRSVTASFVRKRCSILSRNQRASKLPETSACVHLECRLRYGGLIHSTMDSGHESIPRGGIRLGSVRKSTEHPIVVTCVRADGHMTVRTSETTGVDDLRECFLCALARPTQPYSPAQPTR